MAIRWFCIAVLGALVGCAFSQQTPRAATGPVPNRASATTELQLPGIVTPQRVHGVSVRFRTKEGDRVAKLFAELGPQRLLLLPTGELRLVASAQTRSFAGPILTPSKVDMQRSLASAGLGDFQVATEEPYVFVYACSDGFFQQTRSILTSLFPGIVKELQTWGLSLHAPRFPLVVVIMPDRESFDDFKRMPPEVIAYYSQVSNYVVLYEDQKLSEAAPEFALKEAAYTVAHEGVHQILANTGVQQRLSKWPFWISEGLPEYFCPLNVNSRLIRQGDVLLPERELKWTEPGSINDLRMRRLLKMKADGTLLRSVVVADELNANGYAISWGLVHFLASKRSDVFRSYLQEVAETPAFHETTADLFTKYFGENFVELEAEVGAYLLSDRLQKRYQDPIANQTHYVIKSVTKQGRNFSVAVMKTTSPAGARAWKEKMESLSPTAKFFSFICRNAREADYQMQKVRRLRP